MRTEATEPAWDTYSEEIDAAMAKLGAAERSAVTLRYFCGLSLREVGEQMSLSEEAARKRVDRGLEKLQTLLSKKVIAPSAAGLAVAMAANGAEAAPASVLAIATGQASASVVALAKGVGKMMAWAKRKVAAVVIAMLLVGVTVAGVAKTAPTPVNGASKPVEDAFLSADALLKGWEARYGSIQRSSSAATEHLVEFKRRADGNAGFADPDTWLTVDRIGDEKRYHVIYSMDPKGLANTGKILEYAYDGKKSMEYLADERSGRIVPERLDDDKHNLVDTYLLISPGMENFVVKGKTIPYFLYLFRKYSEEGAVVRPEVRVRKALETVNGEKCHVIEYTEQPPLVAHATLWLAHGKGMLPMKFEFSQGEYSTGTELEEIARVQTATGDLWYPTKAHRHGTANLAGHASYEFTCNRYIPNGAMGDADFRFTFPRGVQVYDKTREIVYRQGAAEGQETVLYRVPHK